MIIQNPMELSNASNYMYIMDKKTKGKMQNIQHIQILAAQLLEKQNILIQKAGWNVGR